MSYGYKAKTNASQVAIRDWYSTNDAVLMRVANGSTIEVGTRLYYDSDGTAWRQCAYGFQKLGFHLKKAPLLSQSSLYSLSKLLILFS